MPTLAVVSVHAPGPAARQWLDLQAEWLFRTTPGCRFGVVENGVTFNSLPDGAERAGHLASNEGHSRGLALASQWLRSTNASHYLILDSDAFPVKLGWLGILDEMLQRFRRRLAAPIRFENLDRFPHPCAVLLERTVLDAPWFCVADGVEATNLLGDTIRDVSASMVDLHTEVLPLLRSNVVNVHPVAAAIYQDCFYHHGAGSREFRFRVTDRYRYLDGWPEPLLGPAVLQKRLFRDPEKFVALLRGSSSAMKAML